MSKICLSIETTGTYLGLSLVQYDQKGQPKVLTSVYEQKPMQQSELLFPYLSRLLKQKKLTQEQIDLLAVDTGPGSFTGVRVGVAAARALAQNLEIPLIGLSSLEAVAFQSKEKSDVAVCFPALKGEVYFAAYRKSQKGYPLSPIIKPRWSKISDFISAMKRFKIRFLIGPHSKDLKAHTRGLKNIKWSHTQCDPHPNSVAALAVCRMKEKKKNSHFSFRQTTPLYLQPSWAERRER